MVIRIILAIMASIFLFALVGAFAFGLEDDANSFRKFMFCLNVLKYYFFGLMICLWFSLIWFILTVNIS